VKTVRPETAPDFSYRNPFANDDSMLADYGRWELGPPVNDARGAWICTRHSPNISPASV
jgi:hypothetical protein